MTQIATMTPEQIIEKLQTLAGKKATLFYCNDFGFPITTLCTIEKVTMEKYAQYDKSILITVKPKGKRLLRGKRFHGSNSFLVYEGHIDLNAEMFTSSSVFNGMIIKKSELCFSNNYFKNALTSTKETPIINVQHDIYN